VLGAAWPLIRTEFSLSYSQIGLLISIPALASTLLEPAFGVLADAGARRRLVVGGGAAFALALAMFTVADGFVALLVAGIILYPASGAFVGLSQTSLMDLQPGRREWNMARWTLVGSIGSVVGPALLAGAGLIGLGWREVFATLACLTVPTIALAGRVPRGHHKRDGAWAAVRRALHALKQREVLRWLVLLQSADLLLDVLAGFLALYFVDVVRTTPAFAAVAIAIWTTAGLLGDGLLLLVLRRISGRRYLRTVAAAVAVAYPLFLLVPGVGPKVVLLGLLGVLNAGWYAIPQAALYEAVPGGSGIVLAIENVGGTVGLLMPLVIGVVAGAAGLQTALWIPLAAPLLMLALLPRPGRGERPGGV
jgi:FSR family fosmidomycin resistance protein-like MFS transporter